MSKFHNRTRTSQSIPKQLLRSGKLYLIPLYYLLLTSELAREGIKNSGSYKFADHIYNGEPKGKFLFGYLLDALLLNLKSAKSFRSRYLYAKEEIHKFINNKATNSTINVLAVPCGLARELFEVADELKKSRHPHYKNVRFHGLDLDEQLIQYMTELNEQFSHNMTFWRGDALSEKYYTDNKTYDIIISMGFTEFLSDEDTVKFYKIVRKSLKKAGKFITSGMIPHKFSDYLLRNIGELHTSYRSKERLEALAKQAGFTEFMTYQDPYKLQTMLVATKN